MCLEKAKQITPEKDITCYKACVYDIYNDEYYSPFQASRYVLGRTKYVRRTQAKFPFEPTIYGGAFHSFANKDDAIKYCELFNRRMHNPYNSYLVVIECSIPKSSVYVYEGVFTYYTDVIIRVNVPSYASQRIKPVKVVYQK